MPKQGYVNVALISVGNYSDSLSFVQAKITNCYYIIYGKKFKKVDSNSSYHEDGCLASYEPKEHWRKQEFLFDVNSGKVKKLQERNFIERNSEMLAKEIKHMGMFNKLSVDDIINISHILGIEIKQEFEVEGLLK